MSDNYIFVSEGYSKNVLLFGEKICQYEWLDLGREVEIYLKAHKKIITASVYQVQIRQDYYQFAAIEYSDDFWMFFTLGS